MAYIESEEASDCSDEDLREEKGGKNVAWVGFIALLGLIQHQYY